MASSAPSSGLPPALPGDLTRIPMSCGDLTAYVAGEGAPLLLIHSINAAASAAEMRPLHINSSSSLRSVASSSIIVITKPHLPLRVTLRRNI